LTGTFDLVSQNSINYACVVKVRHTPNARAYVTHMLLLEEYTALWAEPERVHWLNVSNCMHMAVIRI